MKTTDPTVLLDRKAMLAMDAVEELVKLDPDFAIAFMMQGSIAIACDNGLSQKDIAKSFAMAMAAFGKTLQDMAHNTAGLTAH